MNSTNQPRRLIIGSYQDITTPREDYYNVDRLYKLHLLFKMNISITGVSILMLEITPC